MKPFLLFCAALSWIAVPAIGRDINASSCSRSDVQSAINSAADGDRVLVPSGSCVWSSQITVDEKGIIIQGAGIGQTRVRNSYRSGPVLKVYLETGDPTFELTGFTFDANELDTGSDPVISITGGGTNAFRLHHFELLDLRERGITVQQDGQNMSGLIDNAKFTMPTSSGGSKALSIFGTGSEEHQPFTRPFTPGTEHAIYVEDCEFIYGGHNDGAQDAYGGARYVFRYNTVVGTNIEHHGADSGGYRGVHTFEIYNNVFRCTGGCNSQRNMYLRSGTGVIFDNHFSGNYYGAHVTNYRSDESHSPWGRCNGSSQWDENRSGQSGYACLDQIGHVFGPSKGGNNVLEPLYAWGNTQDGSPLNIEVNQHNADQHIKENRDFYNGRQRPGYTPYTYPHPLRSGSSPPTTPPPSGGSPCDLTGNGTIDVEDVQLAIDMTLGVAACTANVGEPGVCNVVVVQRVINAATGGSCLADGGIIAHSVRLGWSASSSSSVVGYNIYRKSGSSGAYTRLNPSLVTGTSYTDGGVEAGQTYQYAARAVDDNNIESIDSNIAQATVPSP